MGVYFRGSRVVKVTEILWANPSQARKLEKKTNKKPRNSHGIRTRCYTRASDESDLLQEKITEVSMLPSCLSVLRALLTSYNIIPKVYLHLPLIIHHSGNYCTTIIILFRNPGHLRFITLENTCN